jgi:hypothetical protein
MHGAKVQSWGVLVWGMEQRALEFDSSSESGAWLRRIHCRHAGELT